MAGRLLAGKAMPSRCTPATTARAADAPARALPQAEAVVIGDLPAIAGMRQVAAQANATGRYDAVIHNAGIGYREPRRRDRRTAWPTCSRSTCSPRTC